MLDPDISGESFFKSIWVSIGVSVPPICRRIRRIFDLLVGQPKKPGQMNRNRLASRSCRIAGHRVLFANLVVSGQPRQCGICTWDITAGSMGQAMAIAGSFQAMPRFRDRKERAPGPSDGRPLCHVRASEIRERSLLARRG